ncbi:MULTISPECIES: hypothetical protein [Desulfobacula]|uniref:Uncharacterized protein n=2 Tax=Desulfobacula TaxID=28222 RepID=K0NQW5_DESTT|nr:MULTISPECIES: hypothetical protein [Desulfobacula]CCK82528.1 uncharacterized protein TOL2_C43720 [Desulfobacula toluolica Tol2]SDU62162.1 hypothetical protein SAMN04487931_11838 [Desulfobacula phenolica]
MTTKISINNLIEIVKAGGKIKKGVDVYNSKGVLLLDKSVLLERVKVIEIVKDNSINLVPVNTKFDEGLWDINGNQINLTAYRLTDSKDPDTQKILPSVRRLLPMKSRCSF